MDILNEVEQAGSVLEKGGIILYPTDTIWGLGCDALNPEAIDKLYALKKRPLQKGCIVLLESVDLLDQFVVDPPGAAIELMKTATRPLTIVFDRARGLPKGLVSDDGSIAIRIPKHDFCLKLLMAIKKPIVSTSANVSGVAYPANFGEISEAIRTGVDHIVDKRFEGDVTGQSSKIIRMNRKGETNIIRE